MGKINSINFDSALGELSGNGVKPIYFLLGNDQFLQQYFIQETGKVFFGDLPHEKQYLLPDEMRGKDILDALNARDLFSSKKLFVLRNPNSISSKKCKDEILDYCKNPPAHHCLIICHDEWSDRLAFIKSLLKIVKPVSSTTPFESGLKKWIHRFFKENGIENVSRDIIDAFLDIGGDSLSHIKNEVDKVCISIEDPKTLTPELVSSFGGWKKEFRQYEFFRSLGKKDLALSLKLGQTLMRTETTMLSLMYPLTEFFQKLLFLKMRSGTKQNRFSFSLLSKTINDELDSYGRYYTKKEIESALRHLGEIDRQIKTSKTNDESIITEFVFETLGHG